MISLWRTTLALLGNRCPRCHVGRIFSGHFKMNDPCPNCGLIFQREEGYFLGAMYFSYLLGCVFIGGGYFLSAWLWQDVSEHIILPLIMLAYMPLVPAVFRYSRTMWIYFERWSCPTDVSAGPYEKRRADEFQDDAERRAQLKP